MATPQHRCVFVGNIPYDATEEQLIQICEEVGPVVSFRLVTDRETGKPKGYGFCEYKDEETALSARRNLQGYEINGRQLRVDFAENDKGADRNREQGRGGPGMVANADIQKQLRGPWDSSLQPIGLRVAEAAAAVMTGTLGGAQTGIRPIQNGLQNHMGLNTDPLTLHLAKMSRSQLNEIMSELKVMATKNKELARQLLLSNPQLSKALFQAEIMLGMVSSQMLQMPSIQKISSTVPQAINQEGQQFQQSSVQHFSGINPLAQNSQFGLMPRVHVGQSSSVSQSSLVPNQIYPLSQDSSQPQMQFPQLLNHQALQQGSLPVPSGVVNLPSMRPQPFNFSVRPQVQSTSSSLEQQMQPALPQKQSLQVRPANVGYNSWTPSSIAASQPTVVRPPLPDMGFKPPSSSLGFPVTAKMDADGSSRATNDAAWIVRADNNSSMAHDISVPMNRPSKLVKLADGTGASLSVNQNFVAEEVQHSEKQLLPEVDSALLQQLMRLTPEQLSSLPPDQQQQVIQLQQMLR